MVRFLILLAAVAVLFFIALPSADAGVFGCRSCGVSACAVPVPDQVKPIKSKAPDQVKKTVERSVCVKGCQPVKTVAAKTKALASCAACKAKRVVVRVVHPLGCK